MGQEVSAGKTPAPFPRGSAAELGRVSAWHPCVCQPAWWDGRTCSCLLAGTVPAGSRGHQPHGATASACSIGHGSGFWPSFQREVGLAAEWLAILQEPGRKINRALQGESWRWAKGWPGLPAALAAGAAWRVPWAAASRPALPAASRGAGAVVTHPGMLWQCSAWARGPRHLLSPRQSGRATGAQLVQPVRCSSCSVGWHCAMVLVPVHGHVVGIMARLRRWPLGNQVSIWPHSGSGFPILALISGIARYYSYHNNIPVPGSPLRLLRSGGGEDGGSGSVALATRRPLALPWLHVGCPAPPHT